MNRAELRDFSDIVNNSINKTKTSNVLNCIITHNLKGIKNLLTFDSEFEKELKGNYKIAYYAVKQANINALKYFVENNYTIRKEIISYIVALVVNLSSNHNKLKNEIKYINIITYLTKIGYPIDILYRTILIKENLLYILSCLDKTQWKDSLSKWNSYIGEMHNEYIVECENTMMLEYLYKTNMKFYNSTVYMACSQKNFILLDFLLGLEFIIDTTALTILQQNGSINYLQQFLLK
jgi:hypothetical protein